MEVRVDCAGKRDEFRGSCEGGNGGSLEIRNGALLRLEKKLYALGGGCSRKVLCLGIIEGVSI